MTYRRRWQYKKHYADCEIVVGTYDKFSRTIDVVIPDGREKPSGVRGRHFHEYKLWLEDSIGKKYFCIYRAISLENAMKQHTKACKQEGWIPCDPPDGKIDCIYM